MSQIEVDKVIPQSGTALQVGESGDTITIPAGATITNNGTANGFGSADTEKVKVSANDTTAGFLNGKLVAGTNISLTEGTDGGNETLTAALSGTIATAQIADLNVTSGKIANDAVTLAKMAPGTDGNIISYDASGNPVAVATGSAGQVLTSAGAGAPPTFSTAASSDFVKLATTTVSSGVNSISFDGIFSSTYSHYQFIGTGLVHNEAWNSSHNGMRMRVRQSDADKTDSNYMWVMNDALINHSGGTNHAAEGLYSDSRIQITRHQTTGNNFQTSFIVDVHNPLDTAKYKSINWSSSHIYLHDGNSGNRYFHSCPGSAVYRGNTSAYSGVTFFAASGDITAGSISVYGTKL